MTISDLLINGLIFMADYDIRPLQLRILKILLAVDKVCEGINRCACSKSFTVSSSTEKYSVVSSGCVGSEPSYIGGRGNQGNSGQ